MKHIQYPTQGTCSMMIDVVADDNDVIQQVSFFGGCHGNLQGICRLVQGQKMSSAVSRAFAVEINLPLVPISFVMLLNN